MKISKKIEYDLKWWKWAKPKLLVDAGKFEAALMTFEKVWKKGIIPDEKTFREIIASIDKVINAAKKTAKIGCSKKTTGPFGKFLSEKVVNHYQEIRKIVVDELVGLLKREKEAAVLRSMDAANGLRNIRENPKLVKLFGEYMRKVTYSGMLFDFLESLKKPNPSLQEIYDMYISPVAPEKINLASSTFNKFRTCNDTGTLEKAPWKLAVRETQSILNGTASSKHWLEWVVLKQKFRV